MKKDGAGIPEPRCSYDPTLEKGQPIGMFHCPQCGEMVVAGFPHPDYTFDDPWNRMDVKGD